MKKIFAVLLATLFLVGTAVSISGCYTVEGTGKDIERGGKAF